MKPTALLLIACCLLWFPDSLVAQSREATADPVTGTWTGYMGRDDGERQYITVALKLDGRNVTGTLTGPPHRGEVRSGTFDPATGTLKLEVVVPGDVNAVALFEGRIVEGAATGKVSLNNQTGTFNITRDSAKAPAPGAAPASDDAALATIRRSFSEVSDNVTKAAALVPADKYTYRPTQSVRTFGELVAHIADGYDYYCATAAGRRVQWSDAIEKGGTDKATLLQKLKQSTDACKAAMGAGQVAPFISNIGHSNLHYGNLVTYIRMLGLVPPSS